MKKLFYIKKYANNVFYCYSCDWTIKIIYIFGIKIMWIKKIGFSITAFATMVESKKFISEKRLEYINAKKYIKQ